MTDTPTLSRRERRRQLDIILNRRDHTSLHQWAQATRNPLATLSSALFSGDPLRCWRTIEAIGPVAALVARTDLEAVRNLIRHNFWMMNDESGNVGWYAPETVGETLFHVPILINEYAIRLPAFFVEEPFERGAFWAVARVAATQPAAFVEFAGELVEATTSPDPVVRYRALLALSRIDPERASECARRLTDDTSDTSEYDFSRGDFVAVTPGALASEILSAVDK